YRTKERYFMKTHLQLSIATDLKERLKTLSEKSHIRIAALIDMILREHLPEFEARYEPPSSSPTSSSVGIPEHTI
ncbi:MAG: hypothetical protein ACREU8_07580, partial [Gammaproteobacteria bacterium]